MLSPGPLGDKRKNTVVTPNFLPDPEIPPSSGTMKVVETASICCAVADMPRAHAFYEGVLGLKPAKARISQK